jgi:hypothetical protein
MFPPFSDGLHCGNSMPVVSSQDHSVLPPFDGGLHCGYDTATAQT